MPPSLATTTNHFNTCGNTGWGPHKRDSPSRRDKCGEAGLAGPPLWSESPGAAEVAAIYNTQAQLIKLIVKHFADPKCHINGK